MERIRASAGNLERWPVLCLESDFSEALPQLCAPSEPDIVVLSPDADDTLAELRCRRTFLCPECLLW